MAHNVSIKNVTIPNEVWDVEPPLATPENFSAVGGDTIADLSWNTVSGATDYEVRVDSGSWVSTSNAATYQFTGLTNAQVYVFDVRAYDGSQYSNAATDTATVTDAALFNMENLNYQGGFKVPSDTYGVSTASFGYGAIGFNPDNNSVFLAGHEYDRAIAEFTIPTLVNSTVLGDLNTAAAPIQNFVDVISKATADAYGNNNIISGIHYNAGKLMINHYSFYDQSPHNSTNTLILEDADNLATTAVNGYFEMDGRSYAAGWISPIPAVNQTDLGGTFMAGWTSSTARAIIHNSGIGPCAYAFDANDDLANSSTITRIDAIEIMHNSWGDLTDATSGDDSLLYAAGQVWTHASEVSYGIVIPGTDTYLCMGMSGGHVSGMSYGDPPYGGDKGHYTIDENDKYPYYWAFDINDLIDAKNGVIDTGAVVPYEYGVLDLPFQTGTVNAVGGGTFDEATGTMYLTVFQAGDAWTPVVVAYKFGV